MRILVEATQATCFKCKWRSGIKGQCNVTCDYRDRTGKSRIFEDGKLAYDPKYCDKYEEGEPVFEKKKFTVYPSKFIGEAEDEWDREEIRGNEESNYYFTDSDINCTSGTNNIQ